MLVVALREGAQLVAQAGKQEGAEGGVGGDQTADGVSRQLVGEDFFLCDKAVTGAPGHEAASVEGVVRPVAVQRFLAVELRDSPLDKDVKMLRCGAHVQNDVALAEVGDVDPRPHQGLFLVGEAVERGGGEVEGVRHGSGQKR